MAALDLYLATVPAAALLTYGTLGLLALGLAPLAVGALVDHVAVVRRIGRGL